MRAELERIRRVSDMLCTAHAGLRDHYARLALTIDIAILGSFYLACRIGVRSAANRPIVSAFVSRSTVVGRPARDPDFFLIGGTYEGGLERAIGRSQPLLRDICRCAPRSGLFV